MLLLLPLDEIDIPKQLQDAPEPTAAQVRRYIAAQSGTRTKARTDPASVRPPSLHSTGQDDDQAP